MKGINLECDNINNDGLMCSDGGVYGQSSRTEGKVWIGAETKWTTDPDKEKGRWR